MTSKHIRLRLGTAFAVLIAILVGIGEVGLRRMKEVDDTLRDIAGRRMNNVRLVREAMTLSNRNSRITMELFLLQDRAQIEMLLTERSENTEKITALVAEIQGRCEFEKEKRLLAAVEEARKPYVASYLRALHLLVDERKHEAAVAVMVNETLPALLKYHAAWDEFVALQKTQLDMAAKQSEVDYAKARRLASLLVGLAVFVAIAIAIFATRETAHEISARIAAKNEVSNLNATLEAKVMQRTRELSDTNKRLASEVDERRQAQESLRLEAMAREQAKSELRRSEERMRIAMKAAKIGFWDLDVIKDEHVWSDTCKALLGVAPDSPANYQSLMNAVHPDDRKMMQTEIDGAIQEKRGLRRRVPCCLARQ